MYGRMSISEIKTSSSSISTDKVDATGVRASLATRHFQLGWGVFESQSWGNTLSPYWMARSMAGVSTHPLAHTPHISTHTFTAGCIALKS